MTRVDRLISSDQGTQKNDQDDSKAREVLDPAVAIGEGLRRLPAGKHKGDPERYGRTGIGDVVDGVGEERHAVGDEYDDKLQSRRNREDHERPLDRPNAAGGGGDGRVHDTMSVALAATLIRPAMPVVVMTLPARAKAEPVQNSRDHVWLVTGTY